MQTTQKAIADNCLQ